MRNLFVAFPREYFLLLFYLYSETGISEVPSAVEKWRRSSKQREASVIISKHTPNTPGDVDVSKKPRRNTPLQKNFILKTVGITNPILIEHEHENSDYDEDYAIVYPSTSETDPIIQQPSSIQDDGYSCQSQILPAVSSKYTGISLWAIVRNKLSIKDKMERRNKLSWHRHDEAMMCYRNVQRRSALESPTNMPMPQETRERIEKEVKKRKSSIMRKVSLLAKALLEEDETEVDL